MKTHLDVVVVVVVGYNMIHSIVGLDVPSPQRYLAKLVPVGSLPSKTNELISFYYIYHIRNQQLFFEYQCLSRFRLVYSKGSIVCRYVSAMRYYVIRMS